MINLEAVFRLPSSVNHYNKRNFSILALFIACSLLVSACFSPLGKEEAGTITIDLGGASDRAAALDKWSPLVYPEIFDLIEYRALFSGNGGTVTHTARGGSVITVAITPGTWNIEVQATVNGERYGRGTGSAEVKAGQANSARIQMYQWYYELGDRGPGGGIIFYRDLGGFTVTGYGTPGDTGYFAPYTAHYLEVAPANAGPNQRWGLASGDTEIGNGLTTYYQTSEVNTHISTGFIGNGRRDTQIIISELGIGTYAARSASAYTTASGHNDWFLPSITELNFLYQSGSAVSGMPTSGIFWSSSQGRLGTTPVGLFALYQSFTSNTFNHALKTTLHSVRAIRAF